MRAEMVVLDGGAAEERRAFVRILLLLPTTSAAGVVVVVVMVAVMVAMVAMRMVFMYGLFFSLFFPGHGRINSHQHLNVCPSVMGKNLHFVNQTKGTWLMAVLLFLRPASEPRVHNHAFQRDQRPPLQAVRPDARKDLRQRNPGPGRMNGPICFWAVAHPHPGVQIDAQRSGKRVVGVNQTALGPFQMELGERVRHPAEAQRRRGDERLCGHDDWGSAMGRASAERCQEGERERGRERAWLVHVPMPFQQLVTGTASRLATNAFLDTRARKYGQVCVTCPLPSMSRNANVS